jgi:hypothetical protein
MMSEPERRNAWREILGMAEAKEEEQGGTEVEDALSLFLQLLS